jgi:hypothetical protein
LCAGRISAGNKCSSDDACLSGQCFNATKVCAAGVGDNCWTAEAKSSNGGRTCSSDLKCVADPKNPKGQNGTCQYDNKKEPNCEADADCKFALNKPICRASQAGGKTTCQAPATDGMFCRRSDECLSGASCEGNKCVSTASVKKGIGESCKKSDECQSGLICKNKTCAIDPSKEGTKKNGEFCNVASDCISGFCNSSSECADQPVQPLEKDAVCDQSADPPCAHGLQCLSGKTKGDHFTCKAEATSERGEFCASEDDCMEEGFICDKDGKYCTPPDQDSEHLDVYCDPNSNKNQCMTKYNCVSVAYVENGKPTNTTLYHACR